MKIRNAFLATALALGFASTAQATTITYTSGHSIDTVAAALGGVTLASGGTSGSNPVSGFSGDAALATALSGGYGAFDALVLGENLGSITAAGRSTVSSYASGGGHVVVLGAHGSEAAFLNSVFGFSVSGISVSSFDHAPISRVAGTGPATLKALNGSWFLLEGTAPGTVTYTRDAGGVAAFVTSYGAGTVSWLAWDFCECGELDSDQADWFSVLGTTAIGTDVPGIDTPEPTTLALLGLGLLGLGARSRKRA